MSPRGYVPPENIVVIIEELLEKVQEQVPYSNSDGGYDYARYCRVCDTMCGHARDCFVPAMKRWQEKG